MAFCMLECLIRWYNESPAFIMTAPDTPAFSLLWAGRNLLGKNLSYECEQAVWSSHNYP